MNSPGASSAPAVKILGLIAGNGTFPLLLAREAKRRGDQVIAVALPHRPNGLVWRQASGFGSKIVRERSEGDVGKDVVVLFDTLHRGTVTLAYGLTRGETTGARASLRVRVTVR